LGKKKDANDLKLIWRWRVNAFNSIPGIRIIIVILSYRSSYDLSMDENGSSSIFKKKRGGAYFNQRIPSSSTVTIFVFQIMMLRISIKATLNPVGISDLFDNTIETNDRIDHPAGIQADEEA
jgi:hypothetical protein